MDIGLYAAGPDDWTPLLTGIRRFVVCFIFQKKKKRVD
jgi:hypothetical protein